MMDPQFQDSVSADVLTQWKDEAARGKDASFTDWTFFDTNCLSELVKLARAGEGDRVLRFVEGRDILISSTVLQELRHAPDLAAELPTVMATANLYLLPHPKRFWKCDVWRYLTVDRHPRNVLEAYPLPSAFFGEFDSYLPLLEAFQRAENRARAEFPLKIERDRNEVSDERQLGALAWGTANDIGRESFHIEIPVADCRPENFPSIFVYYYAYYFRYLVHSRIIPHPNDFNDLAHSAAAPYCSEFYAERKLAMMLRKQIKNRLPPSPYATAKRLFKDGIVSPAIHDQARRSEDMRRGTSGLLMNTHIGTFTELRSAVLAS